MLQHWDTSRTFRWIRGASRIELKSMRDSAREVMGKREEMFVFSKCLVLGVRSFYMRTHSAYQMGYLYNLLLSVRRALLHHAMPQEHSKITYAFLCRSKLRICWGCPQLMVLLVDFQFLLHHPKCSPRFSLTHSSRRLLYLAHLASALSDSSIP